MLGRDEFVHMWSCPYSAGFVAIKISMNKMCKKFAQIWENGIIKIWSRFEGDCKDAGGQRLAGQSLLPNKPSEVVKFLDQNLCPSCWPVPTLYWFPSKGCKRLSRQWSKDWREWSHFILITLLILKAWRGFPDSKGETGENESDSFGCSGWPLLLGRLQVISPID